MYKRNIFYAVEMESNSAYIEILRYISMYTKSHIEIC